jgi:PIN domain nuclease of toxin-antitoxin system
LDTHVVVWLFAGEVHKLSDTAIEMIEDLDLLVSPMVQLELSYLHEIGRLRVGGADIIDDLGGRVGLRRSEMPMADVVTAGVALTWTRDPFDRLIVGDALAARSPLLTKDQQLLGSVESAVW